MTRFRILTLFALFTLPIMFLVGAGTYHLWDRGWTCLLYTSDAADE